MSRGIGEFQRRILGVLAVAVDPEPPLGMALAGLKAALHGRVDRALLPG